MADCEPYIYRCDKHSYELVSYVPIGLKGGERKAFCPLCQDEFWAQHLTVLENQNPLAGRTKQQA